VSVSRAFRVAAPEDARVIARFTNGLPALVELRRGTGRILLFASDLGRQWNRLPLHPIFAPFVLELVRYLAGPEDERRELTVAQVPSGLPRTPGVVSVGAPSRRVAINVDRRESQLEFATERDLLAAVLQEPVAESPNRQRISEEASQRLWQWALALMLMLLVIEGAVASRPRQAPQGGR
jgi:hypothetical protein